MIKEWLSWLNGSVAVATCVLLVSAGFMAVTSRAPTPPPEESNGKNKLPASSFSLPQESYDSIGTTALNLNTSPVTLQLPDLRKYLAYHGKNNRPDADPDSTVLYFGFTGSKTLTPLLPKIPYYLIYDKKQNPPRYDFSPENKETALWIEIRPDGTNAVVSVRMKNDKGEIIATPQNQAHFVLVEKPFVRSDTTSWEIGKQRVDGTLLARQRARWMGLDRFFERHGGKEYDDFVQKQRIDFDEGENAYSVFVQSGDALVWNNNRWVVTAPGPETVEKPLLIVKKVDDRLINFELWDGEGKTKMALNLLKSNEPVPPNNIMQAFKFVGSRTRSQFVFEINKERIILTPGDWLLQVDKGWRKLRTPEEIDAYVDRKISGYLFVFENVERRDDKQILVGTLFNKARSDFQHIEMTMDSGANLSPAPPAGGATQAPTGQKGETQREPLDEKSQSLELHPHSRENVHEYQKNSR